MKCDELEEMVLKDCIGQMWKCYDAYEVDAAIAELKGFAEDACLERGDNQTAIDELQAENRRLRRALWLARAERAKTIAKLYSKEVELTLLREHYPSGCGLCHIMNNKWRKVERKCRAKAEEYK